MSRFKGKRPEEFNFQEIIYEKKDFVARVTINRPKFYNSYSTETLMEITEAFKDASWDDGVAVIVLTGAGEKAFCTGGDVKEYATDYTRRPNDYWKWMNIFVECHNVLRNIGKPTIARLNGIVAGGGNEFNLGCDLAIMADHATIQQVGTKVGSVAAGGATQWLPITVGDRRAREILWLCEPIDAKKALEWGLVNQVVPLAELDSAVDAMCQKLINKFPECMRYTKQQTNFWKDLSWGTTVGHAQEWLTVHFACQEPSEGMNAFVQKRQVDYRGWRSKMSEGKAMEFMHGPYVKTCSNCGTKGIPDDFEFCGKCGSKLG